MGGITGILVAFQLVTKGHRLRLLPIKGKTLLLPLGGRLHKILCKGGFGSGDRTSPYKGYVPCLQTLGHDLRTCPQTCL